MRSSVTVNNEIHSPEAERAFIGSLFFEPELIREAQVRLRPEHIFDYGLRCVYRSMIDLSLQEKSVNVVNVIDSLRKSQTLQSAGGASVIAEIAGEVATSQRIDEYIAII